jgi:hypothetical protein
VKWASPKAPGGNQSGPPKISFKRDTIKGKCRNILFTEANMRVAFSDGTSKESHNYAGEELDVSASIAADRAKDIVQVSWLTDLPDPGAGGFAASMVSRVLQ